MMGPAPRLAAAAVLLATAAGCGGTAAPPSGPASSPALLLPTPTPAASSDSPAAPPHVMVIFMENREDTSVIGQRDAPYMNSLANQYGLATRWYGVRHPSLPNYLASISGSTWGVADDGADHSLPGPTLVDQLAARGIGWKAYEENMPSPCYAGASSGLYAKKHDPFMYFTSVTHTPAQCARVVPHTELAADLRSDAAPPYIFVTPNLCDDGHNCGNPSSDAWVRGEMQLVMGSDWYRQGGSVVLTWDEGGTDNGCCGDAVGGQIPTIVVTAAGRRRLDTPGDAYGLLRALEEDYGVPSLGQAANAANGDLRPLLAP